MKLPLLILSFTCATLSTYADPLLTKLDAVLDQVESLTSYGPPSRTYGLDEYLKLIDDYLNRKHLSHESLQRLNNLTHKILTRVAYRDGSQRSRIFRKVQQELIILLDQSKRGRVLLSLAGNKSPVIEEQLRLLRNS